MPINQNMESFLQGYTKLLTDWGMPLTAARVMSYLMLQPKPLSLDQIAEGLGISKASAWGAAKHLEQVNEIERFGEPGTKRVLFAVMRNPNDSLSKLSRMLRKAGNLLGDAASVAKAPASVRRLRERSQLFLALHEAIEATMEEFRVERRRAASE